MKQMNVALIGYGRSGRDIHTHILRHLPKQYRIVAAVELDAPRRAMMAKELGCDVYGSYVQLFARKDIDLVINASFSHMHVPITLELMRHGFSVLCEKPLARTVSEVDELIDTARRAGVTLAVFQQSRYAPYFAKVRDVVQSGALGRIVQISLHFNGYARRWDWQCVQAMNGGNLYNTGPHPVDQALQLMGGAGVPHVTSFMDRANTAGDAEDYVKLILHQENAPIVDLEISSCCAYPTHTYNIQGTRGGLMGGMTHLDWKYFLPEENDVHPLQRDALRGEDDTPRYCSETLAWHEESWDAQDAEKEDMFLHMGKKFYAMLHSTLATGTALQITPEQVRRQIAVMQEAHRQAPLSRLYV